jgi:two-component system, NarL family, sensor histidine kinase DevS
MEGPVPAEQPEVRRLERLLSVSRLLLSELDLEAVLGHVLDAARAVTGAQYAALGVLNRERTGLDRFVTRGIDDQTRARIGDFPRGRGVLGVLISDPKPLRLRDVGSHPYSYGFPLEHPPMTSFLGVPIVIRGEPWGNLYLAEAPAGEFSEEDERDASMLADWAAIAVANAGAYTSVQGRRAELELALQQLEATTEIARALAGETDLERVLELVVKRARALTTARGAVVMLVEGSELRLAAAAGDVGEAAVGDAFPSVQTVAGQVLAAGRSERLAQASSRLQFALAASTGARTGLFVPMFFRGQGVGVLEVFDRLDAGPEFSAADEGLLQSFAASAAAAVATAQTVAAETLRRSVEAQEAERARWARELHDETLQELAATKILLSQVLPGNSRDGDVDPALLVTRAVELVDGAIRGLRHLVTDLRPAQLDESGLAAALSALAERAHVLAAIDVEVEVDLAYETGREEERLPDRVETAVYRLAQEALTNAIKHAQATKVVLTVRERGDAVELVITDDGAGFDASESTFGFGLLGMRERAALAGGRLEIDTKPGAGTTVRVLLPTDRPLEQATAASDR